MKNVKKVVSLILALVLMFALVACGSPAATTPNNDDPGKNDAPATDDKVYTWRIGLGTGGETNPPVVYANKIKELAEAQSNGRLKVEVYPSGTLGTNFELPQGVVDGSVDTAFLPTQFFTSFVPELYALDIYGMFDSYEQELAILNENDTLIEKAMNDKGVILGAIYQLYPRWSITKNEIKTIDDFSGVKIWHAASSLVANKVTGFGGISTTFDGGELAVGLQNGTVDGAWCDSSLMCSHALFDFAKYVVKAPGENMIGMVAVSQIWFDTLPADLQEIVLSVIMEALPTEVEQAENMLATYEKTLVDNGCIIIEPDAALTAQIEAAIGDETAWLEANFPNVMPAYEEIVGLLENYGK